MATRSPALETIAPGEASRTDALPRRLGVTALVLIIIAFNAPIAVMAGFAQLSIGFGNGIGAPFSFLVAGAILLVFAVGFVGMSPFIDNPGAFYRFIVAGSGRAPGLAGAFLATTAYILLCAGSYPYMGLVAVDFMTRLTGDQIFPWYIWTLIFLAVVTAIGLLRVDLSIKLLGALVCVEIVLVATWQAAVLIQGGPDGYSPASYTLPAFLTGSPGLGVMFAMVCMIGIESGACFRAETRNPEVAVGRATYISIASLAIFYSLGTWLYIVTQGPSQAVASATGDPVGSFFRSVEQYLGLAFVHIVSLVLVTSQMIAINSVQGSASRYLFALGRDGVLPAKLGLVHRRLESPYVAVLTVAAISVAIVAVIAMSGIKPVLAYAAITGVGTYFILPLLVATSFSIALFYRRNRAIRASRWTRLIAPAISVVALSILFGLATLHLKVLVGSSTIVTIAVAGVVVVPLTGWLLALVYRKHRPTVYNAIGCQ